MDTQSTLESMRRDLAAIVPCYNAGERVAPVVRGLLEHVDHVIVVDDGSTDNATASLDNLGARVIRFDVNQGKGFAMLAGFRAALDNPDMRAAAIVDADGQHDPNELPHLYETFVREEADLVIGSRAFDERQVPWRSRFGNKLTAAVTRMLLRQSIVDTQSGYRLHSRRLLEFLLEAVPGGRYETEMEILVKSVRNGFRVVPAPIQTIYEKGNPSSHFNKLRDSMRIYKKLISVSLRK
ncbi:MAG: glycosyltransferase family 2 protein [Candidatus Hydrogenedentes bacterium]|nr:glycosyltransferase family 2 protein [Candidatus Hydrogenedentota bacterium]